MGNSLASRKRNGDSKNTDPEREDSDVTRFQGVPDYAEWMNVVHRVPAGLREKKKHVYDPSVVSMGPFHHGQPHLRGLEKFKDELVGIMFMEDEDRRLVFLNMVRKRINEVRHFYGGLSSEEHDDEALAQMMLRDACLLLHYLELSIAFLGEKAGNEKRELLLQMLPLRYLGTFQMTLMWYDFLKLENQIPWWVLKLLVGVDERGMILKGLCFMVYGNTVELKRLPWNENAQPLHFLEALRTANLINLDEEGSLDMDRVRKAILSSFKEATRNTNGTATSAASSDPLLRRCSPCLPAVCTMKKGVPGGMFQAGKRLFRTVTELKAKGIYFRPSSNILLTNIDFTSYYVFGVFHLPIMVIAEDTDIAFSNMVAMEMCPGTRCSDMAVASYLSLMKSIIRSSEDVKALEEQGIIVSFVGGAEEIVRMLNEIDTGGAAVLPVFDDIMMRINHHCDNRAKTWIAELVNTYFRSPWTAIALAAAIFLLCLTLIQTYYTINPRNTPHQ